MIRHALAALLLATSASAETVVTDSVGRELRFDAPPTRVVALYNDAFGQMATLGIRPVATLANPEMVADEATYFEDGSNIPLVGNVDGSPDPELVASHDPDLILAHSEEEAAAMSDIATVFVMGGVADPDGVKDNLRVLAAVLGVPERAEAALAAFDDRVAAYAAGVPDRLTVLKLGATEADTFWIGTKGDPACALLDLVATCRWTNPASLGNWSYEATTEAVLEMDPDVIVLGNWTEMTDADFRAALEANPLWGELRAVRDGRVVSIPSYQNPIFSSIAAGEKLLDTLIPAIFPDAFPTGPLTDAAVAASSTE